jgi:hypothetical protein
MRKRDMREAVFALYRAFWDERATQAMMTDYVWPWQLRAAKKLGPRHSRKRLIDRIKDF